MIIEATMRERFILAQALNLAIHKLEEVEGAMREVSNIEHMKDILATNFTVFQGMFDELEEHQLTMNV
tara:strand:+ start:642 stop:845 length:204 start_codon:yes stop_codon:yes gene_type:complete